ncbi:MAG: hypothetical protein M3022_09660, partial [Actinomycetota bacterium]|nr:hypothetical protein [Actinomycetota bacterium]
MNADADTLGVPAAAELLAVVDGLAADDELELDDELPHAATARLAVTASAVKTDLLLSKCTLNPSLLHTRSPPGPLVGANRSAT